MHDVVFGLILVGMVAVVVIVFLVTGEVTITVRRKGGYKPDNTDRDVGQPPSGGTHVTPPPVPRSKSC